jgi:chromosome segregation ATPase
MVSRRYYRSGESEYYILGVRGLKDLHEMFMDTGGRDGTVILLSDRGASTRYTFCKKSAESREIFEEAREYRNFRYARWKYELKLLIYTGNLLCA